MISFTTAEVIGMVFIWVLVPLVWSITAAVNNEGKTGSTFAWYMVIMCVFYLIYGGFAWW